MEKIIKVNYIKKETDGFYTIYSNKVPAVCRMNGGIGTPTQTPLGQLQFSISLHQCNSICPLFGEKIIKHETKDEFAINLKCSNAHVIISHTGGEMTSPVIWSGTNLQ